MTTYNLHRFGTDETAVGHLINGDFPSDDEERWMIMDAPRYRIQKLLDEHLHAQAALRNCRETGKPFVLYLRSFLSEHKGQRFDELFAGYFSMYSVRLQQRLKLHLAKDQIPILKLHGGSDSILSDIDNDAKVLSTHSNNWKLVAAELVQAASAIIFLVSHMTAGVVEEFDLIRELERMHRCIVLVLDPKHTPGRVSGDTNQIYERLADFPNVFLLDMDASGTKISYPECLSRILTGLLHNSKTEGSLDRAINADFTYLEPSFIDSEDFERTENYIWEQLRLLRVLFEDTYWSALKSHGIHVEHFTFSGAWSVAHQIYGLAIATADFQAIREVLSYLFFLYVVRGADLAFLIDSLSGQYDELATRIFPTGVPNREELYASDSDPLKLPAKIDQALELYEQAMEADLNQDTNKAHYLCHAAVICALSAKDCDESERRWLTAKMCRNWAMLQARSTLLREWAVTNFTFAATLFRNLAATDPDQCKPELAMCLTRLGTLLLLQRDFSASVAAFKEALEIRRAAPSELKNYLVNLFISLVNVAHPHMEMGEWESAFELYSEALDVCEQRLKSEPTAIIDMTRAQIWMSQCLANIPNARSKGLEYAQRAAGNLATVSQINPEWAATLREHVDKAIQATSEMG